MKNCKLKISDFLSLEIKNEQMKNVIGGEGDGTQNEPHPIGGGGIIPTGGSGNTTVPNNYQPGTGLIIITPPASPTTPPTDPNA